MNSEIKINDKGKFSSVNWENVKNKAWDYLKQFYSGHDKLKTNFFANEVVSYLNINEINYKIIKKKYQLVVHDFHWEKESAKELIITQLIEKGVEGILKNLYLEVLSELVTHCNEKNKITKFKLGEKWANEKAKDKAKQFYDFLWIKGLPLLKNKKLPTNEKSLIVLIEPLVILNFLEYERNLFYPKHDTKNPLSIHFLFTEEPHLNMKHQLDREYDFPKIAGIFLPRDAIFIKRVPINVYFDFRNGDIIATFRALWALKLVPDNIYLFY